MTINRALVLDSSTTPDLSQLFSSRENHLSSESTTPHSAPHSSKQKGFALVVDDVADVTEMLEILLSHAGYQVVTASSARDALAAAQRNQFDVVISDIGMPEMNGYELAKALRASPGYENIPMIAVTGYSMFNDREQSLRSGFTAHMTKPIDPRALLDLIEQL
jgi:two-component system, chemotaxis family, CheB/CheR fusion protein